MPKVDKQTKEEVVQLLRQLRTTKSAKESERLVKKIEQKVAAVTPIRR